MKMAVACGNRLAITRCSREMKVSVLDILKSDFNGLGVGTCFFPNKRMVALSPCCFSDS